MKRVRKNWLEWTVFGISLVLVLGVLGYLVYDAAVVEDRPAALEVRLGEPQRRSGRFVVPATVENHGGRTAEAVLVEVVLERGGKLHEKSEFQLQFVPRRSRRDGSVVFEADPREGRLRARVLGYEVP